MLSAQNSNSEDRIETALLAISRNIMVVVFGIVPLFFIPLPFIPFDYGKTVFVVAGVFLAIVFFSLSVLRSGRVQIAGPIALWGLWLAVISALVSSFLSGDMRDAFIGDDFGVHTSAFILLLGLIATATVIIGQTKTTIMRLYMLLAGSALVLGGFHVIRFFAGPEFLSLGIFAESVSTPIGGWNDLGLFFGLSILLSLVALEQLPLTKWGKALFGAVIILALAVLAVVNFTAVWIVLGLVSLVMLMYGLTKDRFAEKTLSFEGKKNALSLESIVLSTVVFIVSLMFIIGGSTAGNMISRMTGISYLEVRPSVEATIDIGRSVYAENALVGIGTNKFADAWRLYKDPSINETVFWSTDFRGASGYIPTLFVTTGIFGVIAWILFFGLFLVAGLRMLFKAVHVDKFWYFFGTSSFVGAVYLWGMSFVYVPGVTLLLLAGLFTSITFVAYSTLLSTRTFAVSIAHNKRAGFALVGVVMLVIVASTSALYFVGRQYASVHTYGSGLYAAQTGENLEVVEGRIASAYAIAQNDVYALQLASYQLSKINALLGVPELTTEQEQELQASIQNGINAGQIAVDQDPTEPANRTLLGSIYSVLASASVEGAGDRAREMFTSAQQYDPTNPIYPLLLAQLASRTGDLEGARTAVLDAIRLKSNYTDALFFLTQLDIAEGKTADAVATTRAILSLEPNNPARYYQLGVLLSAINEIDSAITAFEQAVARDTNYANARYFLALAYAQNGNTEGALEQLQAVLALNPGNAEVTSLIERLNAGEPLTLQQNASSSPSQLTEPETVVSEDGTVTTTEDPDTPLISPVNTVPEDEDTESSTEETQ